MLNDRVNTEIDSPSKCKLIETLNLCEFQKLPILNKIQLNIYNSDEYLNSSRV